MKIRYIFVLLILIVLFNSCSLNKINLKTKENDEKKHNQFIYLFDEANKNRLNGNIETALKQYTAALVLHPQSAASEFYIASIYIIKKDFQTAYNYAEKAVKKQPLNFWYNLEKADIQTIKGQTKEAISNYNNLLKSFPEKELLYKKLINIYTQNNDTENLISIYERKQKNFEFSPEIAVKLFNLYLKTRNYTKAEKIITSLTQKYPDDINFKGMAAEYFYSTNQTKKAENIYKELLLKYPNNNDINLSFALFCRKTEKHEEYFKITKKLMSSDLDFIKKTSLLTSGRYRNFPDDKYLILLKELYKNHPDKILANTFFAEYYIDKNNKTEAIPYIQKSLHINSFDFNLAVMLFSLEYDTKDYENLLKDTETYKSYFPNRPKLFLYNGIAEYNLQHYTKAEKTLQSGKNLLIDNLRLEDQFNFYLALVYKKTKNFNKAIYFAKKILIHKNEDIKIYELYGDLLFVTGEKEQAKNFWRKAKENGNNSKNLNFKLTNFNKLTIDDILK